MITAVKYTDPTKYQAFIRHVKFSPRIVAQICPKCPDSFSCELVCKDNQMAVEKKICPRCFQEQEERNHP